LLRAKQFRDFVPEACRGRKKPGLLFVIDVGASGDHDGRDTKYLIASVRPVRGLSCDQLGNRPSHISSDNPSQRQSDRLPA